MHGRGGTAFGLAGGAARDPRSYYAALPREAQQRGDDDGTTGSSRALSFDVSNNAVLANLDEHGFVRRMAVSSGLIPVYETGLPGVFVNKDFQSVEGRIGVDVSLADGRAIEHEDADLLDNLIPRVTARSGQVTVTKVAFAPVRSGRSPRGILLLVDIVNGGDEDVTVTAELVSAAAPVAGSTNPEARFLVVDGEAERADAVQELHVAAGASVNLAAAVVLSEQDDAQEWEALAGTPPLEALEETLRHLRRRYGRLSIPEAPYYAELFERSAELARQVSLIGPDGRLAGSFWGSDANDRPDVWMLDLYYSAFPLAQLDPQLCRTTINLFVDYGLPPAAWGNYAAADEGHPLDDVDAVSHSVGNATAALALAGAHLAANGDVGTFADDSAFLDYGIRVVELLFASRRDGEALFPSIFISDGPSRGDFHTGSNIKAWFAISSMARILASVPEQRERAAAWAAEAERIRLAIIELCRGRSVRGAEYFEGVNRDGSWVLGHDGEETDLTLASVYGFTDIDDEGILNHAARAFTRANPYYVPETGGVSWLDFRFHGPTFPAYIHALAAADSEAALLPPLEAIRARTDLDGSVWWWPHLHEETDPARVLRGPGKCGWAAGALVAKFVHDVVGLRVEAAANRLRFAPFSPWSFSWKDARVGAFEIAVSYQADSASRTASVRNEGATELEAEIEVLLPDSTAFSALTLDGVDAVEQARGRTRFGRTAVAVVVQIPAGEARTLRAELVNE